MCLRHRGAGLVAISNCPCRFMLCVHVWGWGWMTDTNTQTMIRGGVVLKWLKLLCSDFEEIDSLYGHICVTYVSGSTFYTFGWHCEQACDACLSGCIWLTNSMCVWTRMCVCVRLSDLLSDRVRDTERDAETERDSLRGLLAVAETSRHTQTNTRQLIKAQTYGWRCHVWAVTFRLHQIRGKKKVENCLLHHPEFVQLKFAV